MGTLTMGTLLRRVDSFRRYRNDDSNSLKILTSPRRKSLEASFIFPTKEWTMDETLVCIEDANTGEATEQSSDTKDDKIHLNNLTAIVTEAGSISDLLKEQRFRPQLEFERKFLREYSKRQYKETTELTADYVKKKEEKSSDDFKRSTSSDMFDSANFPCPQFEYTVSRHLKKEQRIPAYWLTCAYKFVSARSHLIIVIRQTGILPDIDESKLSASVVIGGQNEKQRIVLAKSQNDKSFKSHEIVFKDQVLFDLQKKQLKVKMYVHKRPFMKKRVAEWKFDLANVCSREKIECKKFVLNI